MPKINLALIFGGRSQEHEVSVGVGAQIYEILRHDPRYRVIPIGIDKMGHWFTGTHIISAFQNGTTKGLTPVALSPDTSRTLYVLEKEKTKKIHIDVAFPWVLGPFGEDGTLQGLLEMSDIPYVGSPVFASAVGFNKLMTKIFLQSLGIPQAAYVAIHSLREWKKRRAEILNEIQTQVQFPCFVKPVSCGSSIGITKVKEKQNLERAIKNAFVYDTAVVVEAAVPHALEAEVAVLGNDKELVVSLPGQVEYEGEFYDFNAKYLSEKWNVLIPPHIPAPKVKEIQQWAEKIFRVLGAAGGARVDFLVNGDTHEIFFNEINTAPGFRATSMFTRLLKSRGLSYARVIHQLISLALERHRAASHRQLQFSSGTDWFKKK